MKSDNPTRRLDKRLWVSLGLFAGLIILHQFLIQPSLGRLTTDAPVINVAGRQRMLSQKLAKEALALMNDDASPNREARRTELAATLQEWRMAHTVLRARDSMTKLRNSAIQQSYSEIQPHFDAMANAAEVLLAESSTDAARRSALASLLKNEPDFLTRMHALVGLYESEAKQHVRQLQALGLTIMLVILGALLAMQFGVMRPQLSIVERKWEEIEANYQLLVESMTDGLVVFDTQGRIEFANQRFRDMLGQESDLLVGLPAAKFISDMDRRQFESLLLETGETRGPVDLKLQTASGRSIDTMISPRRLADTKGNFQGLLLVVTDVTTRKAIERRSQELQTQLAHADRLKSMGAMAAALAHEINQPLGAISNYAQGCLTRLGGSQTVPEDLVAPLQAILRAAHRGGEIVRRTRNFTRNRPHQIADESINDLVNEVEELCRPEARRRCVTIELNLTSDLPSIPVDGIQIQQVLTNLIENSFTALERVDSFRRRIKLTTQQTTENRLEVSVSDSGPGLMVQNAQSVFEPFVTTEANGTGLGLSIARGIVEAHGGRIWNEANEDGGAVFRFTLPLKPSSEFRSMTELCAAEAESDAVGNSAIANWPTTLGADTLNELLDQHVKTLFHVTPYSST